MIVAMQEVLTEELVLQVKAAISWGFAIDARSASELNTNPEHRYMTLENERRHAI